MIQLTSVHNGNGKERYILKKSLCERVQSLVKRERVELCHLICHHTQSIDYPTFAYVVMKSSLIDELSFIYLNRLPNEWFSELFVDYIRHYEDRRSTMTYTDGILNLLVIATAYLNDLERCKHFLKLSSYANINNCEFCFGSPLHICSVKNYLDLAKFLISISTCDLNARTSNARKTPLHCAIIQNNFDIVELLIQDGRTRLDLNALTQLGHTPLYLAAYYNSIECCQRLLREKLRIQIDRYEPNWNLTPLHIACSKGHAEIVRLLMENGANAYAIERSNVGMTPLMKALCN
ncbi:unnamed protein product, partial [Didymodactylos carnosus]